MQFERSQSTASAAAHRSNRATASVAWDVHSIDKVADEAASEITPGEMRDSVAEIAAAGRDDKLAARGSDQIVVDAAKASDKTAASEARSPCIWHWWSCWFLTRF
jgi:hypothetical protein